MKTALASAPSASPPLPGRAKWHRAVHRSNSCTDPQKEYQGMSACITEDRTGMRAWSPKAEGAASCVVVYEYAP